jgi:hypothetical protein
MRLVGRRIEPQLHGADNPAANNCCEKDDIAGGNTIRNLVEESTRLVSRKRRHEVDAGATCDTVRQHLGEFVQRASADWRGERNDPDVFAHAARSSLDATVASAFNR